MNKSKQIYGVDISKDVFDVADSLGNHSQFENDGSGFKACLKTLSSDALVVMEATGYYHFRLAQFLYEQGINVSVVKKEVSSNDAVESKDKQVMLRRSVNMPL